MSALDEIAARKLALVQQSSDQRNEIARVYYQWQARTTVARQVGSLARNPFVLAGLGLVLLKMPWRRTYRMGGWIWKTWKMFNLVRRMFI